MAQEKNHASQIGQAAEVRGDVGDPGRAQEAEGVRQEADAGQDREGISPQGLAATKEKPSALDGYERAKPGEPIFTLQGGDPIAIEMVKLYISKRRQRALDMDEGREQDAELVRCAEAERTLWAMQDYLAGRTQDNAQEQSERSDEPEAVDLFDYRVRAANKLSEMRGELNEIGVELERRGHYQLTIEHVVEKLGEIKNVIEPRRLFRKD